MNKLGVSLMIGYVLLVALAIGLSIGVYFYLQNYLPSEQPSCEKNTQLGIDGAYCKITGSTAEIGINLTNRGFFTIDRALIKIGDADRIFRTTLQGESDLLASLCGNAEQGLEPAEDFCGVFSFLDYDSLITNYEISAEPLVYIDGSPVLCPEGIAKKTITCN
ncbi:MAG: hypothetical protein Q8P57_02690 [Candidatus Pacearchaeota archaeon]|nr:hypothetical protein [Candidatus Pacearchaeota archaeon]